MPVGAHIRIDGLVRQAQAAQLTDLASLLRGVRLDWNAAWEIYSASGYDPAYVPFPDVARLIEAKDRFRDAGFALFEAETRRIVEQIEREKDCAAATASDLARLKAKPGGAAGRINRVPASSFVDRSQPPGDR